MSDVVIKVENLSKQYNLGELHHQTNSFRDKVTSFFKKDGSPKKVETLWALKDVSFEVKRGEILGIIGRNGAGKSTLLKILSRITKPTSGKALINGRVGNLLEVGTGFHPELTGRENIYLNSAILGMKKAEISNKFDEIVAFAEIEKFLDTPVKRYSSGMYVRLAFAVAAHLEPDILLVDEVLAVGDAQFQKKCIGKMGDEAKKGKTILFVSHNMAAVKNLCQSGIYIQFGKIAYHGSTEHAVDCYIRGNLVKKYSNRIGYSIDEKALMECRTKGFEISNVEIFNLSTPDLPVASGDNMRLRIYYRTSLKFISPAFILILKDQNGIEIFRLSNMPISGYVINNLFKDGYVDLEIKSLPLVKGTYYIDLGFVRESVEWYFHAENLIKFDVEGKDIYHSGLELDRSRGMIWIQHSWKHGEK
ncbi:MAG: ABC transporter ATP-binding protein [Deltaproteobacteria bacterium]|nr:ABC transporter ATP-binding protein [Deltaproteobacteria bacterium]